MSENLIKFLSFLNLFQCHDPSSLILSSRVSTYTQWGSSSVKKVMRIALVKGGEETGMMLWFGGKYDSVIARSRDRVTQPQVTSGGFV